MSDDGKRTYFSDGMTEDIVSELPRFSELTVITRNSSFAFRDRAADLREIGRLLNAQYVIEGSVRRIGSRIRITAQLVATKNATHLWAERYDRAIDDLFSIQEEIAKAIVATVAQRVRDDSETAARTRRPEDMRAYDLFLQGTRLTDSFGPGAQERAKALLEAALEIDPSFARAHTGLAFLHLNHAADEGIGIPRERDSDRIAALRCAEKALSLDPNDPWSTAM
jgi:adenylate cyclase